MAFNKNKVMDAARRYVEKGQLDKAIKEYNRVVKEDPKDVRVWLKIGDLHAKKGAKAEAVDTYSKVAKFYSEQGFYLKAVAVYKQILKLDPRLIEVNLKLAELYRQLGLMSDAMRQFEAVAGHFHREGKTKEALATVRQLVELDPENVATRIKLAELYSKEGMTDEAIVEFTKACDYLRQNKREDDFVKVAERLLWHKPDNIALSRELAKLYLKRKDPRRALQKLQMCFKANPRDTETLALLAQAFQALEQNSKTVQVLKELARVLHEDNERDKAADVHRKILALVPNDGEAKAYLSKGDSSGSSSGPKDKVVPPAKPGKPTLSMTSQDVPPRRRINPTGSVPLLDPGQLPGVRFHSESSLPARNPSPAPARPPGRAPARTPPRPPSQASPPPPPPPRGRVGLRPQADARPPAEIVSDFTSEFTEDHDLESTAAGEQHAEEIAKLLTETEVYIKYGLHQKAVDHLRRVFALDDDNVEARERLKEVLLEQGREQEALAELMRLAEIMASRDHERAVGYLRELLGLDGTYQPAFELAEQYNLDLTGSGGAGGRQGGAVAAIGQDGLGGDSYEFDLDDFADADVGNPGFVGASVTRELNPDEVEAMFETIGDDAADILGGGYDQRASSAAPGSAGHYGGYGNDPYAAGPLPEPPAFDPAAAAAFDAEPGYDPRQHGAGFQYQNQSDEPDEFEGAFEEPARTFIYNNPVGQQFDPGNQGYGGAGSTARFGHHDYQAQPMSGGDEFAVDFSGEPRGNRSTRDLDQDIGQLVEHTIQTTLPMLDDDRDPAMDTGLDILAEKIIEPPPGAARADGSPSLEEELEEADFYVAQEMYGDARNILQNLLRRYPDHPLLVAKIDDIDTLMSMAGPQSAMVSDQDYDNLSVLDTFGDDVLGADAAQPSVYLENPVDDEDADTHYDLGLAYKEMGLYDEAVKAFKKVLDSPGREVQCRLMIGLCHREQGNRTDAITQFKAGLHAPGINMSEQLMLYYEIAYSYEMVNDPKEALYFYQAVVKRDPDYRDVQDRMAALSGQPGRRFGSSMSNPEEGTNPGD